MKIINFVLLMMSSMIHANWWFDIASVYKILQENPRIEYKKCFDATEFNFEKFPFSQCHSEHPSTGFFKETFVLSIPQGRVQSENGWVIVNNHYIEEMLWKGRLFHLDLIEQIPADQIVHVPGRVAVITQAGYFQYWHWLTEVLCRLALLEIFHIPYDYVYVPQTSVFMKETLELWGIDPQKIIAPFHHQHCVQADQLIVPSLVSKTSFGMAFLSCYAQPQLLKYVKDKLLARALEKSTTTYLSKRVFVSRQDAAQRRILNEDEIFEALRPYGFERYQLGKFSITDQILLFYNADVIISPQGTGLANSIFCQPKCKIIELFQGLNDCTFWYLSQMMHLDYTPIKTIEFVCDYAASEIDFMSAYQIAWQLDTCMPPYIVQKILSIIN